MPDGDLHRGIDGGDRPLGHVDADERHQAALVVTPLCARRIACRYPPDHGARRSERKTQKVQPLILHGLFGPTLNDEQRFLQKSKIERPEKSRES